MSTPATQTDSERSRIQRIESHLQERLGSVSGTLKAAGIGVAYGVSRFGVEDVPAAVPVREIPIEVEGARAGVLTVFATPENTAAGMVEQLVNAWCAELAGVMREEALLDELSSSWESLEALYEVSSSLQLSNSPAVLLDGLLTRAVTIGPDLCAVLWLVQSDGSVVPAAVKNLEMPGRMAPSGPLAKCIATRSSFVINSGAALREMPDLPPHLRQAEQVALAPIVTSEGLRGVLELWRSTEGTEFTTHLLRLIEALAHQAGLVMDNDRLNRAFVESTRIRRDIEIGSSIQQTLLFGRAPDDLPGIHVAAVSKPSQTVDGDFYDFVRWREACLDVLVGDVMGKGIPAALLGAAVKSAFFRAMAHLSADKQGGSVSAILRAVHEDMVPDLLRLESFVSLCYARFDLNSRKVEFVDCGHPRSIHFRRGSGDCVFLEGASLPLGFSRDATYEYSTTEFGPGDLFLFYSDGLPEARDVAGTFFGSERLADLLAENAAKPAKQILDAIQTEIFRFAGSEQLGDDFTCVIVEIDSQLPLELVREEWNASLDNAATVREWVLAHAQRRFPNPPDDMAYWCLELAAAETFTNIVEHAYGSDPSRMVRMEMEFYPERLLMRFIHWGKAFNPDEVAPPSFDGTRDRGFGLYLVANTMDSVKYHQDPHSGHLITMEKLFPCKTE